MILYAFSCFQTQIFISNYNMGRDESIYPNANSFFPERWLRENKAEEEINPFASLPFGYGARACIGKHRLNTCCHYCTFIELPRKPQLCLRVIETMRIKDCLEGKNKAISYMIYGRVV